MSHSYKKVGCVKGGIDKRVMNKRLRRMKVDEEIGDGDDYKYVEGFRRKSVLVADSKFLRK